MIRRNEEFKRELREHMRDGSGTVRLTHFINGPEELNNKGRLFSILTLDPGCSIGYHVHDKDAELFYILTGHGIYSDNGTEVEVGPGDLAVCETGCGHSIANNSDEVLEFVALIVYA